MKVSLPHNPRHSTEWLEKYFKKNYYKKPYNRFHWWRSYVDKNKPLPNRSPLRDRILNGDFDFGPYKFEAEVVEHRINEKYIQYFDDQGRYVEETSLDRARRKRLLEDFEADEGLTEEKVLDELEQFDDTLIEFYYHITEKYPRKNGIAYL